ncbi:hypothetical protein [Protaetiibacter intestinalis]|uniref:Peptidase n=1 Tax=Protaetiibacter intestinalis TaxID=2419774 RepID=A0A387B4J6_9MICO|nr:hypothetical protein [Protaetiibacter intestinalis]AYF97237.1 hypothetical protein D7I47_02550 [Protaetiibacter intestinalis]
MNVKKTITALAAAFALTIGGAASAAIADPYPATDGAAGPATVAPGGSASFGFDGFLPQESVTFTLTGENASGATLAASGVLAVVDNSAPVTKPASGAGAASVSVTLPANATGTYTLVASAESGSATTTFAVSIAATGADVPAWLIWGGVGAVGLGVLALIAVSASRRTRKVVEQR